ncbi:MAG: RluA family pseudouridine synthase [Candidatus Fournierella pullistercoris]|uniref:Pseudouridine synthase n=1 Tax=Candidatus Allofournierella pullistercoris TaxID=2838597 RepID=A0A948T2F2_9FIRM|nr:RluA family pseudouridine synthase [Candidatus Fournierella pullistercoris]
MELVFVVSREMDGMCLRDFLRNQGVSATLIKAVKYKTNGFWMDGKPVRTCDAVIVGQRVRFSLPPEQDTTVEAEDIPCTIVYESDHVMVLEKPAGMAVHPTLNYTNGTLANAYMGLLEKRGEKGVFRPVNRLDKDTSGLVLCAKNAYAAPILAASAKKIYRAILGGVLPSPQGVIEAPIARAEDSIILRRVHPDGKPSRTEYQQEAVTQQELSLVAAKPVTGRTHQLRVHFAHMGCPLEGDELYGGKRDRIHRHALHCSEMWFTEPATGQTVWLTSSLPPDMQALLDE